MLSGRWKGQFPRLLLQPHILCFSSSKTSGSNLQKHSHSRFIPGSHHRVNSVNSHSHAMLCPMAFPRELCVCAMHKCMEGLGTCALLVKLCPSKGLSACKRHVSLQLGHPGRLPLFHNLHKGTVCAALTGVGRSGSFLHPNYILWEPA